jgi:hypothetical protein
VVTLEPLMKPKSPKNRTQNRFIKQEDPHSTNHSQIIGKASQDVSKVTVPNATMSDMCQSFEKRLVKAKGKGVEFFDGNVQVPSSTQNTNMGSDFGRENEFIRANKKLIG